MNDDVIVLLNDGTTAVIDKMKLRGKLKKVIPEDVVYAILIPVGIYSPQYIMFKPGDLIDGFISATISYQLVIYQVGPIALVSDMLKPIEPVNIKCKCLSDLYLSLHSLCKLDGFNMVYSSVDQSTSLNSKTPLLRVNDLKLTIKTEDDAFTLDLVDSKHQMRKIDKFFSRNFSVSSCLPDYVYGSKVYIDTDRCLWQIRGSDDKGKFVSGSQLISPSDCNPKTSPKSILQSSGLIRYNCMTFVNPSDVSLLKKYVGDMHITVFNNMEMLENIELDSEITYGSLMEHLNYFAIISDSQYKLYTPSDIIEAVMTLRHTLITWQVLDKLTHGDKDISLYEDANVMVSIILHRANLDNKYQEFNYCASIIEKEDIYIEDYYDDFIKKVREFEETIA